MMNFADIYPESFIEEFNITKSDFKIIEKIRRDLFNYSVNLFN